MIEIALCDDNAEDVEAIGALAADFAAEHSEFPIRLSAFTSAAELLKAVEESSGFDLYILDVMMPEMNGIRLAEIIRGRGEQAEILFLTVSREYAVEAFAVRASGYLLKPVSKPSFDEEVLRAVRKLTNEKSEAITVKTKDGMRRIRLHELVMIESFNHTRALTMSDGSVLETSAALSELFEALSGHKNFYMPHRAYIVNLDYSMGIKRCELLMLGNRRIPIPRRQYTIMRELFSNYFFK